MIDKNIIDAVFEMMTSIYGKLSELQREVFELLHTELPAEPKSELYSIRAVICQKITKLLTIKCIEIESLVESALAVLVDDGMASRSTK